MGAINVLDIVKRTGAKILQASTSEVYGDPEIHPQIEEYRGNVNPIEARACYDEGKRCAEILFFDYYREYMTNIRVVSNFIIQALQNQDITIYGDGSQSRSFCYVDDLVDGFIKMMNSN